LTINGTANAPLGVDYNEFEVGSQGTDENEPANLLTSPYSGTVTLNNYVNMEVRHHMPNASFVVGDHAILDMGHMKRIAAQSVRLGEVEVLNGGTLEVGLEKSDDAIDGHFAYTLTLDNAGGKSGGLTMHDGAQLNMQINGDPSETTLYDRIAADGTVTLEGKLKIFVNPEACIGNQVCSTTLSYDDAPFADYVPAANDVWDLITTSSTSPLGDYNGDGTTDTDDLLEFNKHFGSATASADGNKDGVVDGADYVLWAKNVGQSGTAVPITGAFDEIEDDLDGFHFEGIYNVPGKFSVRLVADTMGGGGAVPEPTTLALVSLMLSLVGFGGRFRR
jgi:hypothetical protein